MWRKPTKPVSVPSGPGDLHLLLRSEDQGQFQAALDQLVARAKKLGLGITGPVHYPRQAQDGLHTRRALLVLHQASERHIRNFHGLHLGANVELVARERRAS